MTPSEKIAEASRQAEYEITKALKHLLLATHPVRNIEVTINVTQVRTLAQPIDFVEDVSCDIKITI